MISVIQAAKEGKQIQHKGLDQDEWTDTKTPSWNFLSYDYRIKPEPKYRPFKNADEFLVAQKEHGLYIHCRDFGGYVFVQEVDDRCVYWPHQRDKGLVTVPFSILISDFYHWQDGTPCGILEE